MTTDAKVETGTPALSLMRVLDAPPALVWSVWTDPAQVVHWWGPHGFTVPTYEADLRPGGVFRYEMRAPDGSVFPGDGAFEDIVPHERIVSVGLAKIDGTVAFEARTTVTFEARGAKTSVRVTQTYSKTTPAAANAIAGAEIGWTQQFERLEGHLRNFER